MQDFGFPRVRLVQAPSTQEDRSQPLFGKRYKWKKINYKTLLPKHSHIVAYLVAKTNIEGSAQYMMHAAAHASEFDLKYTQSAYTKKIRAENTCRSRLSEEDRNAGEEVQRVIVCHIKMKVENRKDKKRCK